MTDTKEKIEIVKECINRDCKIDCNTKIECLINNVFGVGSIKYVIEYCQKKCPYKEQKETIKI